MITQKNEAQRAAFKLKTFLHMKNTPKRVKKPEITDKNLPAKSGSSKTLSKGIINHIKSGVFPSVTETKRRVGSALITCAHLT